MRLAFGTVLATAALAVGLALPAAAQTVLRYADYGGNRGIRADYVTAYLDEIESRSEGRIKIERHWAQALLPATKMLEGLRNGVADIATVTAGYSPRDQLFAYGVGDLPVRNPNEGAGAAALYELTTTHPALQEEMDRLGIVYLMNYSVGPIQMVCKGGELTSVEDFSGKKVRATSDYGEIYGEFGATAVVISLPKAYQALDTGMIDCSQAYGYIVESYKLYEVADSFTAINGATIQSNGMFMNRRAFDGLDPKDQEMIVELGAEYNRKTAEAMRARNQEVMAQLPEGFEGKKMPVHTFTEADLVKLDEASQPIIDAWIADAQKMGLDGAALVKTYTDLLAKHLAEQGS